MPTSSVRKKPIQARALIKVEKILDAAEQLLIENGIESITTPRIAKVSGVTVGSIYQYFPHKESILHSLYQRWLDSAFEKLEAFNKLKKQTDSRALYLSELFVYFMESTSNTQHQLSIELTNALRTNAELRELDRQHDQQMSEAVRAELVARELLPKKSKASARTQRRSKFIAELILSLMEMVGRASSKDRKEFIRLAAKIIINNA